MMMDVLLEEDESILGTSPSLQSSHEENLFVEQAKKLFRMCDQNDKGFVVKMDLMRLKEFIPRISTEQLDNFFDNIDIDGMNFITENQFIENIKPILLYADADTFKISRKTSLSVPNLYTQSNTSRTAIPMRKASSQQESLDKLWEPTLSRFVTKEQHSNSTQDIINNEKDRTAASNIPLNGISYNDEISLSLQDELEVANIADEKLESERKKEIESEDIYPFVVKNDNTESYPEEKEKMDRKLYLEIDDMDNRGCTSQVDLRRSIYNPEVKQSLSSRSLAEELRDVGLNSSDIPSEPRPDFSPERIFKVVFIGDSAVGKTCFLHRFCHNRFKPLFNATIGVDFTVKNIRLGNRTVAVQLWDTAGQERFRSITKQYFRKADGVILMYDVTSEQSFLNVRSWIDSVRVGVDEKCVICLVGNKVDLFANDRSRVLTYKQGQNMAEEFNMLFFETSAYTGYGVNECMKAVAMKLQEREDENIEEALKLDMNIQKAKKCCS